METIEALFSVKHLLFVVAELIVALTTVCVFISKIKKKISEPITELKNEVSELRKELKDLKETEVKSLEKHEYDTWISMLRLIICTDEMPLSERIAAGNIYVNQEHKNGEVKCRYEQLLEQYKKEVL